MAVLFLIAVLGHVDRSLISVVLEPIRLEFGLSDVQLGFLSGAPFAICFALASIPLATYADRGDRKWILVGALVLWSAATALCGAATGLGMLLAARMIVGAGEAGATPPSHALIVDYFPPQHRSRAFAVYTSSAAIAALVALAGGGYVADRWGWRAAFLVMGAAAIPVALIAMFVLVEPRRRSERRALPIEHPLAGFRELLRNRDYMLILVGFTFYGLFAYGPGSAFVPAYMVRNLGQKLSEIGPLFGTIAAAASLLGAGLGGWLADHLARADERWLIRLPSLGLLAVAAMAGLAFSTTSLPAFLVFVGLMLFLLYGAVPPLYTAIQATCGPDRRASAVALVLASLNLIGLSLGPLATGALSDLLAPAFPTTHLRYAILAMALTLLPAALCLWLAARRTARSRSPESGGQMAGFPPRPMRRFHQADNATEGSVP